MAWTYHNKPPMGWPLDLSEPINDGIAGYWLLNEGSGNKVFDLSGNGYHSTSFTSSPLWKPGKYGSSLWFDDTDDHINFADILGAQTDRTIEALIYLDNVTSDHCIISKADSAGNTGSWTFFFDDVGSQSSNTDRVAFISFLSSNAAEWPWIETSQLVANRWYHIAVVQRQGVSLDIYVNGVSDKSWSQNETGTSALVAAGENVMIGEVGFGGDDFGGNIEFVRFWNRALSASEIALLYRFPFYGFLNPDEEAVLDQYYSVGVPIMTYHYKQAGGL